MLDNVVKAFEFAQECYLLNSDNGPYYVDVRFSGLWNQLHVAIFYRGQVAHEVVFDINLDLGADDFTEQIEEWTRTVEVLTPDVFCNVKRVEEK